MSRTSSAALAVRLLAVAGLASSLALVPSAAQAAPGSKSADLGVTLGAPQSAAVGDTLTYAVRVSNSGPAGAGSVVVTVDFDPSMTFVSASAAQGSCSGTQHITCSLGSVATGSAVATTIQVRTSAPGSYPVSASVGSQTQDNNAANDSAVASTTVYAADRVATRTAPPVVVSRPCTMCGFFPYDVVTVSMEVVAMDGLPINEGTLSARCSAAVVNGHAVCTYTTTSGFAGSIATASYSGSATYAPSNSSL